MLHYKDKSEGKVHAKVMFIHPTHVHLFHVLVPLLYWDQFPSNWEGPPPGDQNLCDVTASTTWSHSLHSLGTLISAFMERMHAVMLGTPSSSVKERTWFTVNFDDKEMKE